MIPFFFFCDKMGLMKYTDKEIADMLDVKSHGNIYDMVNMQGTPDHVYSTASERDSNGHENPKSSYFLGEIHNEGNAPIAHESTSLNDSISTRADSAAFGMGGVEMLVAGNIYTHPQTNNPENLVHLRGPLQNSHSGGCTETGRFPPSRVTRLDNRLLGVYCRTGCHPR